MPDYTPPDPYAPDLERIRREGPKPPVGWPEPKQPDSTPSRDYAPPDPYERDLERLRRKPS